MSFGFTIKQQTGICEMKRKDYMFWAALPPTADNLNLLEQAAPAAEPLIDLRYGTMEYRKSIVKKSIQCGLIGLTLFADCREKELCDFLLKTLSSDSRVILTIADQCNESIKSIINNFKKQKITIGIEVDSRENAQQAQNLGCDFLVASTNEAYGSVSVKTSLILVQELLDALDLPLIIRGSLGPQGTAGALIAGCAGAILDSQLLLLQESPLSDNQKSKLVNCSASDTVVAGALLKQAYRFLCMGSSDQRMSLLDQEEKIFIASLSQRRKARAFEGVLKPIMLQGFKEDATILPVGQGIAFSKQFAEKKLGIKEVIKVYYTAFYSALAGIKEDFPFAPNSRFAKYHKIKYPLVQGPMACITNNAKFAAEVAHAGALPCLSVVGCTPKKTRKLLQETRSALNGQPFGVGIVNFSSIESGKEQISAVFDEPPDFITVAGGDTTLAKRCDRKGIGSYVHAPTVAHLKNLLEDKIYGVILEGHEAGGHVGTLGSLVLWELGTRELVRCNANVTSLLRILFAGGIATARGALMAGVMALPLTNQKMAVGLQLGTAYLMTNEIAESGALSKKYQQELLLGKETIVTGQAFNLPTRWSLTKHTQGIAKAQIKLKGAGLSLCEQKQRAERINVESLCSALSKERRRAQKGKKQNLSVDAGCMCGQIILLQNSVRSIAELHAELTEKAQKIVLLYSGPEPSQKDLEEPIAIVGMGGMFPDANNLTEYWNNILNHHYAVRQIPKERWDPDLYYHAEKGRQYKTYSKIGAYIDSFKKDPLKFHIPPVSAPFIERLQFILLEAAHQALEDSGYLQKEFSRDRAAVFIGGVGRGEMVVMHYMRAHWARFAQSLESINEFRELKSKQKKDILGQAQNIFNHEIPDLSEDSCGGVFSSILASRICHCFDLRGTSLVLDAACASSLAAVEMGVNGLRQGKFDLILVGAAEGRLDPATYMFFSSLGAISNKGSFPFDERADGFVMGEGAGMIILKRLSDATRDGDKIYALIQGIGSSSDGRAKGITAPDVNGQIRALERAYRNVSFTPDTVSLVEAHGTGTWVGDTAEMQSLTQFFQKYSWSTGTVGIGTVKSMIGHLKSAAGIAGLIKVALALYHKVMPPTINCEQPRKDIDWNNSPFFLLNKARPWRNISLPRRAAVNAFGFGGINYHAILEEAPIHRSNNLKQHSVGKQQSGLFATIFVLRARTRKKLINLITNSIDKLKITAEHDLKKFAINLANAILPTGQTLAVVAANKRELVDKLKVARNLLREGAKSEFSMAQGIYFSETLLGSDEKIAFLFPGQGSQYLDMGGDLSTNFPFVEQIFQKVNSVSGRYIEGSVCPMLRFDNKARVKEVSHANMLLLRPDYNHPLMLALGMGLYEVLMRAGVGPDMVAGHSSGEYLALYAAGVFDMKTAIDITTARGSILSKLCSNNGVMLSVNAPVKVLNAMLRQIKGFAAIANKNCPAQTIVGGDTKAVDRLIALLDKENIPYQQLQMSNAYHTKLLKPYVKPFLESLDFSRFAVYKPKIPVQSNLTGRVYRVDKNFACTLQNTLARHLTNSVDFIGNILSMYKDGARLFIEIGPKSVLSSFVDNILVDKPHWAIPSNLPSKSATLQILNVLAFCAARGIRIDMNAILIRQRQLMSREVALFDIKRTRYDIFDKETAHKIPDWVSKCFANQDKDLVQKYLKERSTFLRDTLMLDFTNFKESGLKESSADCLEHDMLKKQVVGLISRKTGYPFDTIDIDLDVEMELGLDSIKQVEIIREIAQELDIDFGKDLKSQRYRITTPRQLIEACRKLITNKPDTEQAKLPRKTASEGQAPAENWKTDCHCWVSEKVESSLSGKKDLAVFKNSRILLLASSKGPGPLLKRKLEKAGADVFILSPSCLPEDLPDNLSIVLNLWSYMEEDGPNSNNIEKWWDRISERAAATLRIAQQVISSPHNNKNKKILWAEVTSLGGELGAHSSNRASGSAGIGLGISRCLACEFPDRIQGLYLDFDTQESHKLVSKHVFDELAHPIQHFEIGYLQEKRFEIHWNIDDQRNDEQKLKLNSQSVVLAIGGARGITASICRELAISSQAQFIIVGRSPFSMANNIRPKEPITFDSARKTLLEQSLIEGKRIVPTELDWLAWKQVWDYERACNMDFLSNVAGKVTYHQCDIADAKSVKLLIDGMQQKYKQIDLVIQGASDLTLKSIEDFKADEFTKKMRSKALGTACLLTALSHIKVASFINLSSIAGRWGNIGQASYAVGHEIASILVAGIRKKHLPIGNNIFFGPWLNVGMVRIGDVMRRLQARGSNFITNEAGSEFFIKEFANGISRNVAFCGNRPLENICDSSEKVVKLGSSTSLFERIDMVEQGTAEGHRVFDLERDRFVAEHYVDYENPIMPGVIGLEMIAQVASALSPPKFLVTDIEDINFPHPGIFPRGEPRKFYARARVLSKEERGIWLAGEVFSFFIPPGSKEKQEICHVSCKIRFGYRSSPQEPSLLLVKTGLGDCRIDAKPLYDTNRRKGRQGMFRTINSFSSVTRDGADGEISAFRIKGVDEYSRIGSLMLLDGLMDLVNLSTNIFQDNESSLAAGIQSIRLFASDNIEEKRLCRTRIRGAIETGFIYDVEAMDSTGKVLERINGVRKQTIKSPSSAIGLPEPIWELLRENPIQKEVKRLLGCKSRLVLAQIPISLVKDALKIEKKKLLSEQLSGEELKRYGDFAHPKRQLEWLAGRIATKCAVRVFLDAHAPVASNIVIRNLPDNRPYAIIDRAGIAIPMPHISISHSNDMAVSVASENPEVGIDVEKIEKSVLEIAQEFCTKEELVLIATSPAAINDIIALTIIWATKEAARKAVGPMTCSMQDIILTRAEFHGDYIVSELCHPDTRCIRSVAFQNDKYVYAVSILLDKKGYKCTR